MIYQLIQFDRSVNDFYIITKSEDFVTILNDAISAINKEVDRYNDMETKLNSVGAHQLDYVEYDEMYEIFDNGQNYIINNKVFGIIGVELVQPEYEDVVLVIWDVELNDMDIKAIRMPFNDKKFFIEYMKRVVEVFGGQYKVYSLEEFDNVFNGDILKTGNIPYVIHTKIVK